MSPATPDAPAAKPSNVFVSDPIPAFVRLQRLGTTGCATIRDEAGMYHRILVREGVPVWVVTADEVAPLAAIVNAHAVSKAAFEGDAGGRSDETLLTELVASPSAMDHGPLRRALRECHRARLSYLFELRSMSLELVERSVPALPEWLTMADVFLLAARAPSNLGTVDAYIERLGGSRIALESMAFAGSFLNPMERRVLAKLRQGPTTVAELEESAEARRAARSMVFAACLAESVRTRSDPAPTSFQRGPSLFGCRGGERGSQ